jgi:hypothetical protein
MRRALVLAVFAAGCANHPSISAAVAGGTIGFGACYVDVNKASTCSVVGASTAVFLGGLTWLATRLLGGNDDHIIYDDDPVDPRDRKIVREHPDAGVDAEAASPAIDAAARPDAGVDSPP